MGSHNLNPLERDRRNAKKLDAQINENIAKLEIKLSLVKQEHDDVKFSISQTSFHSSDDLRVARKRRGKLKKKMKEIQTQIDLLQ